MLPFNWLISLSLSLLAFCYCCGIDNYLSCFDLFVWLIILRLYIQEILVGSIMFNSLYQPRRGKVLLLSRLYGSCGLHDTPVEMIICSIIYLYEKYDFILFIIIIIIWNFSGNFFWNTILDRHIYFFKLHNSLKK